MEPQIVYDFDPHNLPHELLSAIGIALASAAQTEHIIDAAIAGLLGVDFDLGMAVTTHMATSLKFNVLSSLSELLLSDAHKLARFDNLIEEIRSSFNERNSFAHDQWCRNPADGSLYKFTSNARTHFELKLIPSAVDEIKLAAERIYRCGLNLQAFISEHGLNPKIPSAPRDKAHASQSDRKNFRKRNLS